MPRWHGRVMGAARAASNKALAEVTGHRPGSRTRSLTGTFGPIEIAVPRARLTRPEGGTAEWKSQTLRAYQRRTLAADALITGSYLAGTNTRRVVARWRRCSAERSARTR